MKILKFIVGMALGALLQTVGNAIELGVGIYKVLRFVLPWAVLVSWWMLVNNVIRPYLQSELSESTATGVIAFLYLGGPALVGYILVSIFVARDKRKSAVHNRAKKGD